MRSEERSFYCAKDLSSDWKEFCIGNLFHISPTKAYKCTNTTLFEENGRNPIIVNSGFNNGVGGFSNKLCTEKAGIITFSDTAAKSTESFFYQEKDFIGYPHVQAMRSKGHQWNKQESLFLVSVIKSKLKGKYDFVRKMTRENILRLCIKLPVDSSGNPDYDFMERYINALKNKNSTKLKILSRI